MTSAALSTWLATALVIALTALSTWLRCGRRACSLSANEKAWKRMVTSKLTLARVKGYWHELGMYLSHVKRRVSSYEEL